MKNWLEILFWKIAKNIIIRNYGCNCSVKDVDEILDLPKTLMGQNRCGSCVASEVIEWIDNHISLIKEGLNDIISYKIVITRIKFIAYIDKNNLISFELLPK